MNTKILKKEEKDKKKEQKMIASKAFEEWVRIKKEQYIENKGEQNDKLFKTEKQNRKQKEKKSDKPPLPFEAWAKKKENQINEKLKSEKQKELEKKLKENEKEERKKLAELSVRIKIFSFFFVNLQILFIILSTMSGWIKKNN